MSNILKTAKKSKQNKLSGLSDLLSVDGALLIKRKQKLNGFD